MLEKCKKMPCFGFQYRLRVGRVKCLFAGRNLTKIIEKCPLSFARIRKNMYLCIKRSVFCIKNNRVLKGTIVSM